MFGLKMLPDRIIVGEVKGREVFDLVQAMNKGYVGGMTFLQAQSPRDALVRLEKMAIQDNFSVPILEVRKMMAAAIDLIVQQTKLQDGSWKIANVTEVQGFDGELQTPTDIFVFEQQGLENGKIIGRIKPTGYQPTFLERLKATGVPLPPNLFGF